MTKDTNPPQSVKYESPLPFEVASAVVIAGTQDGQNLNGNEGWHCNRQVSFSDGKTPTIVSTEYSWKTALRATEHRPDIKVPGHINPAQYESGGIATFTVTRSEVSGKSLIEFVNFTGTLTGFQVHQQGWNSSFRGAMPDEEQLWYDARKRVGDLILWSDVRGRLNEYEGYLALPPISQAITVALEFLECVAVMAKLIHFELHHPAVTAVTSCRVPIGTTRLQLLLTKRGNGTEIEFSAHTTESTYQAAAELALRNWAHGLIDWLRAKRPEAFAPNSPTQRKRSLARDMNSDTKSKLQKVVAARKKSIVGGCVTLKRAHACRTTGIDPATLKARMPDLYANWDDASYDGPMSQS